jgi:uncharacterized protein (DUF1330 family)
MPDNTGETRYEVHVGLRVSDEQGYQRYRDGMTPLLESVGGYFRYDMRVSELLKGEAEEAFNRVFVISFPDEQTKLDYFADERYKAIRAEHFNPSVSSVRQIAGYTTQL